MEENTTSLPNALDTLSRDDFKSEAEYLEAATDLNLKRNSPEFKKAYMSTQWEYAERKESKAKAERAAMLDAEIRKTTLNDHEESVIHQRASDEVSNALKDGTIQPEALSAEIINREAKYRKEAIQQKARCSLANQALRSAWGASGSSETPSNTLNSAIRDALKK